MAEPKSRLPSLRTLAIWIVVLAIPFTPWYVAHAQRLKAEHLAEPIAKRLTNRDIDVKCPGLFGKVLYEIHEGSVQFDADGVPANETKLSKKTCAGLRTVASDAPSLDFGCLATVCGRDAQRAAEAIAVLTHEIMHLRGSLDEGITECLARGRVEEVGLQMGISPASAAALKQWQSTTWQERLPDRYRNASC
ncbi:MAG TPA: hypothetical protein VNT22_11015 [Baekduia sp.]|nr:hypothetical protein [Baekduia sp.]